MRTPGLYIKNIDLARNPLASYEFTMQYMRSFNPNTEPTYNFKTFFDGLNDVSAVASLHSPGNMRSARSLYAVMARDYFSMYLRQVRRDVSSYLRRLLAKPERHKD